MKPLSLLPLCFLLFACDSGGGSRSSLSLNDASPSRDRAPSVGLDSALDDLESQDAEPQTQDIEPQTQDVEPQTQDVEPQDSLLSDEGVLLDLPRADGASDLGQADDLERQDAGPLDATPQDLGADAAPEPGPCALPLDPDRDRIALLSYPFSEDPEIPGTEMGLFLISPDGRQIEKGSRLEMGTRISHIQFLPSGRLAIILGEDGSLISFDPSREETLDRLLLDEASPADLIVHPDDERVFVVMENFTEEAGVFTVRVGCGGRLRSEEEHLGMRLSGALALLPDDPERALLLGGQAVFDPVDDDDLRLLRWAGGGWVQEAAFDLWGDFVDCAGIAISPDGQDLLIPNGSPFSTEGGELMVARLEGNQLRELQRLEGMEDARQVRFAPQGTALLTLGEPGRLVVLSREDDRWRERDRIAGVGLAEQLALVHQGVGRGLILAPAIDPREGPRLVILREQALAEVELLRVFPLGSGPVNIPGAIGIAP